MLVLTFTPCHGGRCGDPSRHVCAVVTQCRGWRRRWQAKAPASRRWCAIWATAVAGSLSEGSHLVQRAQRPYGLGHFRNYGGELLTFARGNVVEPAPCFLDAELSEQAQ